MKTLKTKTAAPLTTLEVPVESVLPKLKQNFAPIETKMGVIKMKQLLPPKNM